MGRSDGPVVLLEQLAVAQATSDGWVTGASGLTERGLAPLVRVGLARMAGLAVRAELSAKARRPVLWAARLTDDGWDTLAYARARPVPAPREEQASPLYEISLRRSEMEALRRYLALGGQLRVPPAEGLDSAVQASHFDPDANRWIVHVDDEQRQSMARAFFLERHAGTQAAANRFARAYGVTYPAQLR
ncbi:DUF6417 family protein [Streptomyces sp. NPDC050095]|uniref:DUF6417 family protein n=1 Tax=unclassified Streptomyces TaxID=2593676 RepID=UPI003447B4CE